jgi:hypothetical protein
MYEIFQPSFLLNHSVISKNILIYCPIDSSGIGDLGGSWLLCLGLFVFLLTKTYKPFNFPIFWICAYLMKVIPGKWISRFYYYLLNGSKGSLAEIFLNWPAENFVQFWNLTLPPIKYVSSHQKLRNGHQNRKMFKRVLMENFLKYLL